MIRWWSIAMHEGSPQEKHSTRHSSVAVSQLTARVPNFDRVPKFGVQIANFAHAAHTSDAQLCESLLCLLLIHTNYTPVLCNLQLEEESQ
jgi:hypothetical protein